MTTRAEIIDHFTEVAREHGKELPPLTDETDLLDSGLDSLSFAVIVTRLEDSLGVDPFSTEATVFPVTFGELVHLYEAGLKEQVKS